MTSREVWTRCALIASLGGLQSCGPGYVTPDQTGGELLPETEAYDYLGGYPFSASPDGSWLLFARSEDLEPAPPASDLVAFMLRSLSAYMLYDLSRLEATRVVLGVDVPEFAQRVEGSFVPTGGCWIPKGDGWWAAVSVFVQYLIADPGAVSPEWVVDDTEPYAYRDYCPLEDNSAIPELMGRFRIAEPGGRRISIVDAEDPETVLARHRAPVFPGTDITLGRLRLAPDGTHLAYDAMAAFGTLSRPSTAFVLSYEVGNGPTALASTVDALRWGADHTTLYAAVRRDGARGIYRWRVGEMGSNTEGR